MALISPTLDNRTFAQLREELIRRIPVYTPTWTNHNESDPGIALLELFAYLGESLLYRFNQIPDTARIEFLRMLGVQPRSAQPAHVFLAATTDLPSGVEALEGTEAKAGAVSFETEDEVYVWPLDVLAAGKSPDAEPNHSKARKERTADALSRAHIKDPTKAQFYTTTVVSADPLEVDPTVVDVSAQVDRALWIALLSRPATDATTLAGKVVFVGVAFDENIDRPFALDSLEPGGARLFHSDDLTTDPPPMLWRLWNGDAKAGAKAAFQELHVVGDTTRGMVTNGVVKVELPRSLPPLDKTTTTGDELSPPPLTDAKLAARVIAWIQVSRPASREIGDAIGTVRWVGVNAVRAVQARTATPELVGAGTGDGNQRYPLAHHPVLTRSVALQVEEPTGWMAWQEVDNFVASTADDRHFMVDLNAGAVSFGRAKVPQLGEGIRVVSYRYGGGTIGNVAAGAVNKVSAPGVRHDRAVIADDFRELALQVPGVQRAEALPLLHPDNPTDVAAGVVSVVIFPDGDLRNPGAPLPELGLLRRAARYLDARRLVTTELYVIPPEYVRISMSVGVQVREGYQVDAIRRWVELILRQYLAPLPPYGPDAKGWPLGRAVRRAELEAVAVQVEGVEYLHDLLLGAIEKSAVVKRSLIPMQRWQVPELAKITVVAGPPLALGTASAPPPTPKIPVPLPPDVC